MKILDELWYGNILPSEYDMSANGRIHKLLELLTQNEDELLPLISEETKVVYDKLRDNQAELSDVTEREIFGIGFRLGARIMLEVMSGNDIPHIDEA